MRAARRRANRPGNPAHGRFGAARRRRPPRRRRRARRLAIRPWRQDVEAVFRHDDHMLPLRGPRAVLRHDRPAVGELPRFGAPRIEHRLDREDHSRRETQPRAGPAVMEHLRLVVIDAADAVAAILAHDAEALAMRHALDRMADVAERRARAHRRDARHHRFVGRIDETPRRRGRLADAVHAARVAIPAVVVERDVDIDDVAVLQRVIGRNAVAHHVVHGSADRLRITVIADVRGPRAQYVDDVLAA